MKALTISLLLYTLGNLIDNSVTIKVEYSMNNGNIWEEMKQITNLLVEGDVHTLGYKYSEDTETWDTWRYSKTKRFPLTTTFTDAGNVKWRVTLHKQNDQVNFVVPISRELIFWGDERDRVSIDATCRFASVSFYYQGGGWSSHGIKVKTRGLRNDNDPSTSNMKYWSEAIKVAGEAAEVVDKVVDILIKLKDAAGKKG